MCRRRTSADRIGKRGERIAARALRRRGYRILARRWRTPAGEVDLLCRHAGELVIVEVKARAGPGPLPAFRIDGHKRRRLRAARRYVAAHGPRGATRVRIDVVLVRIASDRRVAIQRDVLRHLD